MSGKKGADWFEESDRDKMNMLDSCRRGNLAEVAKFLSSGVDVDEEDALQIAAAKGHRSLAEFLIRKCASLDLANYAGMTPFLHACREGHQDIVTLLANHGTNIHATTGLGVSAMALACAGRHLPVVRTLKGLNVSLDLKQQQQGRCPHQIPPSPYMVAFFQMDIQICGFLKQQNANLWQQVRSLDGLDISRLGQLLGLPEMLMRLNHSTEHTLRVQREEHKNDLRLVVQRGDELMLGQMLQDGQVPVALQDGLSPLMFAAVAGQTRIAELLLRSGRGGAVDAQENVLGMTALMFAIVAGESPVVQLLLRQGANPRILSTTREPFSALDLALFSEISRDSLKQLCAQWLAKGGNKEAAAALVVGGGKETPRPRSDSTAAAEQQQQLQVASRDSTTGRGAITPARLRRALESIGKNLGLAGDEMPSWALMGELGMQQSGADLEGRPRLEWAALDSALLDGQPRAFVLAEHILRGDSRPPGPKKAGADSLVLVARQIAISWMSKGHALRPIPTAGGQKAFEAEEREADGLYSAAQRNADRELRKARHQRYQPSRKSSRTPMTPKVMRAAQQQAPKSPSLIDPQRTMRKAPLRLGHYRASSGGSQTPSAAESPRISGSSSASILLNPQPPRFPQPLTKELVQSKLHDWKLADQFHEYFAAEEVDELSFASLREEEVRQVLARRKPAGEGSTGQQQEMCHRFAGLIREIKRCTASSELL